MWGGDKEIMKLSDHKNKEDYFVWSVFSVCLSCKIVKFGHFNEGFEWFFLMGGNSAPKNSNSLLY